MRLYKFGQTVLDYYNQVDDIGSGETPTAFIPVADGGALDGFGEAQKAPGAVERVKSMRLRGISAAAVEEIYLQILALRGKRDKLYRRLSSGELHWMYARLAAVQASMDYQRARYKQTLDVSLRFVCQEATWRGGYTGAWVLDDGEYLDSGLVLDGALSNPLSSSPASFTISVGSAGDAGRAPVRAMRMIVSAGNAEMSNVVISRSGGESLHYYGAIPAAGQLVIDTGTMQVTCTGETDAYDNLDMSATADLGAWFTLLPGDNSLTVAFVGGGTGRKIEFEFYEAWF